MARVFLSYAREDLATAHALADALAEAGHQVWWDRHLTGGARFASQIDEALKNADAVVVLWSEAANRSVWVQDEAAEGRDSGRLVPVLIEAVRPPLGFRQFHSIDLSRWRGQTDAPAFADLVRAIGVSPTEGPGEGAGAREEPRPPARGPSKPSICVLPFHNGSGDAEQEYFSDGISEDIITDLAKVSALSVVSRYTAFRFKGSSADLREVARQLNATHVVEGSVRKAGTRLRITAQLTDGSTGNSLWAERYDRDLTDIFDIQEEIARAIVSALKVKLLPQERSAIEDRGTHSPEAYDLYLMARQYWVSGNDGDPRRDEVILRLCRRAIDIDPEYARVWSLVALTQSIMKFRNQELEEDGTAAAERALELNPSLAEPHCVLAAAHSREGDYARANAEIAIAVKLDPDSWEVNREVGYILYTQGQAAEAVPYFEKAAALIETDYRSAGYLMSCRTVIGDVEGANGAAALTLDRAQQAYANDRNNAAALAWGALALGHLGEAERAKEWIRRALLIDPTNLIARYNLACVLSVHIGDAEGALDLLLPWVEAATAAELRHLKADADIDPLRSHPKYQEMLAAAEARLASASG